MANDWAILNGWPLTELSWLDDHRLSNPDWMTKDWAILIGWPLTQLSWLDGHRLSNPDWMATDWAILIGWPLTEQLCCSVKVKYWESEMNHNLVLELKTYFLKQADCDATISSPTCNTYKHVLQFLANYNDILIMLWFSRSWNTEW